MEDITAIILAKNEELNIGRCIESLQGLARRIVVVDSHSQDKTIEIAKKLGAEVYVNTWKHYADQFNWALDNVGVETRWVYRIDADEVVTEELKREIISMCKRHSEDDVNGFVMKFKIFFLGKFLRHGGVYPFYNLTIFKFGKGRYENRPMGEHIVLTEGKTIDLKNDCLHYDFKNLSAWIEKHNAYASREVQDFYSERKPGHKLYHEAKKATHFRDKLYYKLPLFMRARFYYWYRYYLKMGFLDGTAGRVYAFLQAYWYRYLVDAKIVEERLNKTGNRSNSRK